MAHAWKPYMQHTASWRAKAQAEGISRRDWDSYGKLSPKTRKTTNPREYAKGQGVAAQRMTRQRADITETLLKLTRSENNPKARRRMRAQVNRIPDSLVARYHKVKPETHRKWASDGNRTISADGQPFNPSWYR